MTAAERLTDPIAYHGEGPFWDAERSRLLLVDMLAGAIVSRDESGRIERHAVPSRVAAVVRRRASGGFVVATERDVLAADAGLTAFSPIATGLVGDGVRLNEGGCDPLGAFLIGSMAYGATPAGGSLQRVAPDGTVTTVLEGVTVSNGLQFSTDGLTAFYVDSPTGRIDRVDVDPATGAWSGRRSHVEIEGTPGGPDGLAIDVEGGLWVALYGGGAVRHYDPAGALVEEIAVPGATKVTACAFGDPDLRTLYITTSREGLGDDEEPQAGSLYAIRTDVAGAPPLPFAG
ncbi:SMP-30/gluconolactonase/LRE family protein [Pseudolysinimonas sp.]|uniref:SMP-30/gluconolactonase/LRE family protein n=1 Tax=Pseudolysinimonas sp. TaxID=2680009 RepID=UPI003F81A3E5